MSNLHDCIVILLYAIAGEYCVNNKRYQQDKKHGKHNARDDISVNIAVFKTLFSVAVGLYAKSSGYCADDYM